MSRLVADLRQGPQSCVAVHMKGRDEEINRDTRADVPWSNNGYQPDNPHMPKKTRRRRERGGKEEVCVCEGRGGG